MNYFPISAYSGLLKFDMKIFVNVARLEIDKLFTEGTRGGGASVYFGHIPNFFFIFLWIGRFKEVVLKETAPAHLGLELIREIGCLPGPFVAELPEAQSRAWCQKLRAGREFGICLNTQVR